MKNIVKSTIIIFIASTPFFVFGANIVPCDGTDCSFNDLILLFSNIFNFLVTFGIVVSTLAFAYAGFLYITSQGDTSKISKATAIFTNFAIGLVFLLSTFLIVNLVLNSLGLKESFRGGLF